MSSNEDAVETSPIKNWTLISQTDVFAMKRDLINLHRIQSWMTLKRNRKQQVQVPSEFWLIKSHDEFQLNDEKFLLSKMNFTCFCLKFFRISEMS